MSRYGHLSGYPSAARPAPDEGEFPRPELPNAFSQLPADVRKLIECVQNLLMLYVPKNGQSNNAIAIKVGAETTVTISISAGSFSKEIIEDTMAHLAFYKKYYPKEVTPINHDDAARALIASLAREWSEHREAIAAKAV